MRNKSLIVLALLVTTMNRPAFAGEFSDVWTKEFPGVKGATATSCPSGVGPQDQFFTMSHMCLESSSLSKECSVVEKVKIDSNGFPQCKTKSTSSPEDAFYCTETVESICPVDSWMRNIDFSIQTTAQDKNLERDHHCVSDYLTAHPKLSNCVVMHFIPVGVCNRYPSEISPTETHSMKNLVPIAAKNIDNPALEEFRLDWVRFCASNPVATRKSILDHASALKRQYSSLFLE